LSELEARHARKTFQLKGATRRELEWKALERAAGVS
jgi:hypothetical protein